MKKPKGIFFLLIFLLPSLGFAQSYRTFEYERDQIIERTKFRLGPFRVYPAIQLKDIGYDDNVYLNREEDDPISDYTATISPQMKTYLLFRNFFIFSFTENPEYVYFLEQKRERRWNNILSLDFKFLFFHRFVFGGSYSDSNRRFRVTSEFDTRANIRIKEYSGRIFYETARHTSFGISGSISKISFEDVILPEGDLLLSRILNREERSGYFEFYYRVLTESFFFINGGYTEYNFDHPDSKERDSYSFQAYSGIRFPLLGRLRGTLALGYKRLMPKRLGKKGFSGLVGNTELDYRLKRYAFRVLYTRDYQFSYWTNSIFFLEDRYGIGLSFYLTQFLRLDYDFTYGENIYPESITIRQPDETYKEIKREDIYRIHSVGIAFRIVRNTGVGVRIYYWDRESNISWEERSRLFVGGYVTYDF